GKWPNDKNLSEVLIGKEIAKRKKWKIGDQIQVHFWKDSARKASLTITGILQTGGTEENSIVTTLALAQYLANAKGKLHSIKVRALTVPENSLSRRARQNLDVLNTEEYDRWYCTAYVSTISHQIEEAIPNASPKPIWQVAASEGSVVKKIQLLMLVVTITAFLASALGISSLMSTTIMERSPEIGLMKALGAPVQEIYLLFMTEAAMIGVIGGIFGFFAGTGLSQVISLSVFKSTVSMNFIVLPVIVIISTLIVLAGSYVPSRMITKLYPAEILHGRK
ncbi:MAG: putative ABC transport system permease protein, partial [bacterium]